MTLWPRLGLLSAMVILASFIAILWTMSGTLALSLGASEISIPGYMVWCALLYAIAGTWITYRNACPQFAAWKVTVDRLDGLYAGAGARTDGERVPVTAPGARGNRRCFARLPGSCRTGRGASACRTACYPANVHDYDDAAVRAALDAVGLGRWSGDLNREEHWARVLSGGEQQRLALARARLNHPDWPRGRLSYPPLSV